MILVPRSQQEKPMTPVPGSPSPLPFLRTLSFAVAFLGALTASAQSWMTTSLAGDRNLAGHRDGIGQSASFLYPMAITADLSGNLYVADAGNHVIRKIDPTGRVSTLAGSPGIPGDRDGFGADARFRYPNGITVDGSGTIYVADTENCLVRKISAQGLVTTLAGRRGDCGEGDGLVATARFSHPTGVAVDITGVLYVADRSTHTIRKVDPSGTVSTFAGAPLMPGSVDERRLEARFALPFALTIDAAGNLYVADSGNHTIRKITSDGFVTTYCGIPTKSGSRDGTCDQVLFNRPSAITIAADGSLYLADTQNHTVRKITPDRVVSTVAGAPGVSGFRDASGSEARFYYPYGITIAPSGSLVITDMLNHVVRRAAEAPATPIRRRPVGRGGS